MKTNREKLPMMSVSGSVDHPGLHGDGYWVGYDGYGRIAMSVGGIVYNYALSVSKFRLSFLRRALPYAI